MVNRFHEFICEWVIFIKTSLVCNDSGMGVEIIVGEQGSYEAEVGGRVSFMAIFRSGQARFRQYARN